jgi:uncharacterized protein YfdQ (DUF2303 family)
MDELQENIAQTVIREARLPIKENQYTLVPEGSSYKVIDTEQYLPVPARKHATVSFTEADSFIDYVKRHGSLAVSTVWGKVDYKKGEVSFISILNDHGDAKDAQDWRDHQAKFSPAFSEEWNRWFKKDKNEFGQAAFAAFIEENLQDIRSIDGSPSGTQMLEMATAFEANQDLRFKSSIRLQNGAVQLNFSENDDAATLQKMQVFERFTVGIPVFWSGDAYQMSARLRYRARDGKVTFWFELIRADKVLEDATKTLVTKIKEQAGMPFFFGTPFA